MKTILKFLNVFILILIISLIIDAFGKLYSIVHYLIDNSTNLKVNEIAFPVEWSIPTIILFLISSTILISFLVYIAFIFRKVITSFSKNNYFSSKNVMQLSKVGKGLIIYDNNLIDWRKKDNFNKLKVTNINERLFFDFFKSKIKDDIAFERFKKIKFSYQLIAYLFFIKNLQKYLPISQEQFDKIFHS